MDREALATRESRPPMLRCAASMRPIRRLSAWLPLCGGLALIALAARQGPGATLLVALPGAMLVLGGGRSLLVPDRTAPAHTALGAVLTLMLALPLGWIGGLPFGIGAAALGAIAFIASRWLSIRQEPALEDVPAPPPT